MYYEFFDTVVNQFLIGQKVIDLDGGSAIGLVVETQCHFNPISFPSRINAGLRVGHLGNTSIKYEIGLFRDDDDKASAQGHFVHVYVDRASNRPVSLSPLYSNLLSTLLAARADAGGGHE